MIHYDPTQPKKRPSKFEIYQAWAIHMANAYYYKFIAEVKYQWRCYGDLQGLKRILIYVWPYIQKLIKPTLLIFIIILFFAPILGGYFK